MKFVNNFLDSINYYIYQICKIFDKNTYKILRHIRDYTNEDLNSHIKDTIYSNIYNNSDIESS
jgi:hypothetical protein